MKKQTHQTYYFVCFTSILYELSSADKKVTENKIKRRLKYYQLGNYDQSRIDTIRAFKNEVYREIASADHSVYFKKNGSVYAELKDFDLTTMKADLGKKYPALSADELSAMLNLAVYQYHLR